MASYCEVCRGLFDDPHPHDDKPQQSGRGYQCPCKQMNCTQCAARSGGEQSAYRPPTTTEEVEGRRFTNTTYCSRKRSVTSSSAHPWTPSDAQQRRSDAADDDDDDDDYEAKGGGRRRARSAPRGPRQLSAKRRPASSDARQSRSAAASARGGRQHRQHRQQQQQQQQQGRPGGAEDAFSSDEGARRCRSCSPNFRHDHHSTARQLPPRSEDARRGEQKAANSGRHVKGDDRRGTPNQGGSRGSPTKAAAARGRRAPHAAGGGNSYPDDSSLFYTTTTTSGDPDCSIDSLHDILDRIRAAVRVDKKSSPSASSSPAGHHGKQQQQQRHPAAAAAAMTDSNHGSVDGISPSPAEKNNAATPPHPHTPRMYQSPPDYQISNNSNHNHNHHNNTTTTTTTTNSSSNSAPLPPPVLSAIPRYAHVEETVSHINSAVYDRSGSSAYGGASEVLPPRVQTSASAAAAAANAHNNNSIPRSHPHYAVPPRDRVPIDNYDNNNNGHAAQGANRRGDGSDHSSSSNALLYRQLRLRQDESDRQHGARMEELRKSFMELCTAVRGDLQELEQRMEDKIVSSHHAAEPVRAAAAPSASATIPMSAEDVIEAVRSASAPMRRHLAQALLPELRDVIQHEVQAAVRDAHREQQASWAHHGDDMERRLRAFIRQEQSHADARVREELHATLPIEFSSVEAFDAHMRAAARAVLAEEDTLRYQSATEVEDRVQKYTQHQQRYWRQSLEKMSDDWKAYADDVIAQAQQQWSADETEPLHRQLKALRMVVEALTKDFSELSHQQEELLTAVETCEKHCSKATTTAAAAAAAASSSSSPETTALRQGGHNIESYASADQLRIDVVQPALEHTRRLLAAHQKMLDAMVEQRCGRAEQSILENRHIWEQNVVELRSKLTSLRRDVRGALSEMSDNLNVACPGL